jgi:tetratricopeptide (TPR) repeat protein
VNPDGRIERAGLLYERAVFGGEAGVLETAGRELDAVEADLSLARGRIVHALFLEERVEEPRELALFERATDLYRELGDVRGEAEALFWVGVYRQVVRHDEGTAIPFLERSLELAGWAGDTLTMSYALRHLGIAAHAAGRLDEARGRLEESLRMRREIPFMAGVAANMVGLIYIAAAEGRRDDALALAAEAAEMAAASDAGAIARQVAEARAQLWQSAGEVPGVSGIRILRPGSRVKGGER